MKDKRQTQIDPQDFEHLPAVLTSAEAAKVLRVGVKEVRQLVDRGDIHGAKCGPRRVIRIARSAILAFLAGKAA